MHRLHLNAIALVLVVTLSPCHADQPVARSAMSVKAADPLAQRVVARVVAAPVSATSIVNRVALNPQPLPPGPPDPDRARNRAKSAAEKNGVIIVGGSPQKPAAAGSKLDQKK